MDPQARVQRERARVPSPASARAHLQPSLAAAVPRPPPPAPLPRLHNLETANPPPSPPVDLAVPHTQALAHLWPPSAPGQSPLPHYSCVLPHSLPHSQGVPREEGPHGGLLLAFVSVSGSAGPKPGAVPAALCAKRAHGFPPEGQHLLSLPPEAAQSPPHTPPCLGSTAFLSVPLTGMRAPTSCSVRRLVFACLPTGRSRDCGGCVLLCIRYRSSADGVAGRSFFSVAFPHLHRAGRSRSGSFR